MKKTLLGCALMAIMTLTGCVYHDNYRGHHRHHNDYQGDNRWNNGHWNHDNRPHY